MPEALQPGTWPCVCSAGKVPVLLLDLLPNVLSKASSIYAVFVLLDLGLKPGKMRLNKGLYTAYIASNRKFRRTQSALATVKLSSNF